MDFDKITPLTKTPTTKENQSIETTKVLDKYYSEDFLKNYFKLTKIDSTPIEIKIKNFKK
jgi:hypothetical protein